MPTRQNEIPNKLYAGLYLQTKQQMRFWGWSRRGWGKPACRDRAFHNGTGGVVAAGPCAIG